MENNSSRMDVDNAKVINEKDPNAVSSVEAVFSNQPLSNGGKLIILVGFFLVFPTRVFLILTSQAMILSLVALVLYLFPKSYLKKFILRCLVWMWGRSLLFLLGFVFISTKGKRRRKNVPPVYVVVSNHVSWIDPLYLIQEFGCTFVAKAGVKKIFIIGKLLEDMGAIFVYDRMKQSNHIEKEKHREQTDAKGSISSEIIERLSSREAEMLPPLCIFPEGTTSNGRSIIHFHKGAFLAGVPVMPVAIKYPIAIFDPSYCNVSISFSIFCTLCTFLSFMEVNFLPVYLPSEEERQDPVLYSKNVQKQIAETLNQPIVDKTFADKYQFYVDIGLYQPKKAMGNKSSPQRN